MVIEAIKAALWLLSAELVVRARLPVIPPRLRCQVHRIRDRAGVYRSSQVLTSMLFQPHSGVIIDQPWRYRLSRVSAARWARGCGPASPRGRLWSIHGL